MIKFLSVTKKRKEDHTGPRHCCSSFPNRFESLINSLDKSQQVPGIQILTYYRESWKASESPSPFSQGALLSPESKGASAPMGRFVGQLPGFNPQWPKTESNDSLAESHTLLLILKTTRDEPGSKTKHRLRKSLNG